MEIKTKFDLGQSVYPITYTTPPYYEKCETCKGTNKIKVGEEIFDCPKRCSNGSWAQDTPIGHFLKYGPQQWHVYPRSGIIGKVDVEIYWNNKTIIDEHYRNKRVIQYMLTITGIGSGTCWDEENLFESPEKAQKECEARNAKVAE